MPRFKDALEESAHSDPVFSKEQLLEDLRKLQADQFERANNYTNIVIGGGYAGAFAIWSLVSDVLSKNQRAWIGMLLLVSILVFVMWEVTKMILIGVHAQNFVRLAAAEPLHLEKLLQEQKSAEVRLHHKLGIIWARFVLPVTIGTALVAAGVLVYAFVREIVFI